MSRIKLVLLCMLATTAVRAVASSTASAAEKELCGTGAVIVLCFEEGEALHEAEAGKCGFTGKLDAGTESLIEVETLEHIHITCTARTYEVTAANSELRSVV